MRKLVFVAVLLAVFIGGAASTFLVSDAAAMKEGVLDGHWFCWCEAPHVLCCMHTGTLELLCAGTSMCRPIL